MVKTRNRDYLRKNLKKTNTESREISLAKINEWNASFIGNKQKIALRNVIAMMGTTFPSTDSDASKYITYRFSNTIKKANLKSTDQGQSGRCWLFAMLNQFRHVIIKNLAIDDFEFSEVYLQFYDKLERVNYLLQWFIDHSSEFDVKGREIYHMLFAEGTYLSDGGQWQYALNLVKKYGLIPKSIMPETYTSNYTDEMNKEILNIVLPAISKIYNYLHKNDNNDNNDNNDANDANVIDVYNLKECIVHQIYDVLVKYLGTPPKPDEKFIWNYTTSKTDEEDYNPTNGNVILYLSPLEFFQQKFVLYQNQHFRKIFGTNITLSSSLSSSSSSLSSDDLITITVNNSLGALLQFDDECFIQIGNYPNLEFDKVYEIEWTSNMVGGKNSYFLNLDIKHLQKYVEKSILAEIPVWFAGDVNHGFSYLHSSLDERVENISLLLDDKIEINKKEKLITNNSNACHAMCIVGIDKLVGFDKIEGKMKDNTINYQVENSWGYIDNEVPGLDGFLYMSEKWFKDYIFNIVVHKYFLSKKHQQMLKNESVRLMPYENSCPAKICYYKPSNYLEILSGKNSIRKI